MIKVPNFVLFVSFVVNYCVYFFGCGSATLGSRRASAGHGETARQHI